MNKIWEGALTIIELSVSKGSFKTWFKETSLKNINNGVATIIVPNLFTKNWLSDKFDKIILKSLIDQDIPVKSVSYVIGKISKKEETSPGVEKTKSQSSKEVGLGLKTKTVNKDNLNPKYSFENFVVGTFNEVAFQAAQVVIKNKEALYNPFFVYGNTGYGKTHLMQAMGNYIKEAQPEKRVYYITSEQFYMDVIDFIGLKSNKTNNFKQKYRGYDVLIIDDIHFLSKKERTQEELFHLFNSLYNEGRQIILSSDKHPSQIHDIEERLKSRFSAGMVVDIQGPDYESKLEIIKNKLKERNIDVSVEIVEYVASAVKGNIRELEGILNNISINFEIYKKPPTMNSVKDILRVGSKSRGSFNYKRLFECVANYYNIEESKILNKTRKKEIVKPRQVIMYILREDFDYSYPSIGEKLGGRDHTTVMHSYEKIKNEIKTNPNTEKEVNDIRSMIS